MWSVRDFANLGLLSQAKCGTVKGCRKLRSPACSHRKEPEAAEGLPYSAGGARRGGTGPFFPTDLIIFIYHVC